MVVCSKSQSFLVLVYVATVDFGLPNTPLSMIRATTAVQTRRMPSIFAKLQDKGHEMLFGKDGGTGKYFYFLNLLFVMVHQYSS